MKHFSAINKVNLPTYTMCQRLAEKLVQQCHNNSYLFLEGFIFTIQPVICTLQLSEISFHVIQLFG